MLAKHFSHNQLNNPQPASIKIYELGVQIETKDSRFLFGKRNVPTTLIEKKIKNKEKIDNPKK